MTADTFVTEIKSNNLILASGSGNSMTFTVKTADGKTLEYGNTSDSRLALDNQTQWKWMLHKVYDNFGNTIKYTYEKVDSINQILISEIEYGGDSTTPVNMVIFHYSTDSEYRYGYIHDDIIVSNKLLDSISIESNSDYFGSYGFHYNSTSGERLLDEVFQYDKDNEWYNPTTISWETPIVNLNPTVQSKSIYTEENFTYHTGDFTGDGIFDLVVVEINELSEFFYYYLYKGSSTGLSSSITKTGELPHSFAHHFWGDLATAFNSEGCGTAHSTLDESDISYVFSGDFDGDGIEELFVKVLEWNELEPFLPYDLNSGFTSTTVLEDNQFENELCDLSYNFINGSATMDYGMGCILNFDDNAPSSDTLLRFKLGGNPFYGKQYSQFPDFDGRGYNSIPDDGYVYYYDPNDVSMDLYCNIPDNPTIWGEFNGDGKADYIIPSSSSWTLKTYNSSSNSFTTEETYSGTYLGMLDLNGDGIMAYVSLGAEEFDTTFMYQEYWLEYCTSCLDFSDNTQWSGFLSSYSLTGIYNSFCEDEENCSNNDTPTCRKSFVDDSFETTSKGFELTANHLTGYGPEINFGYFKGTHTTLNPMFTRAIAADVDSDGKNDLLLFDKDSLKLMYYDFTPHMGHFGLTYSKSFQPCNDALSDEVVVGDYNGDGIIELLFPEEDGILCFVSSGGPYKKVAGITNGMSTSKRYYYKPLTDNSVYSKDTTATYPVADFITPWYVVEGVSSGNGVADSSYVEYDYTGAKIHLQGKGFLGFMKTTIENDLLNTSQVSTFGYNSTYFQTYPLSSIQKIGTNNIKQVTNYTNIENVSDLQYSVQTDSIEEQNILSGTNITTSFMYNDDGLIEQKKTSYNGDATVTEKIWYIKRGSHIAAKPHYISRKYDRGGPIETDSTYFSYYTSGVLVTKREFCRTDRELTTDYSLTNSYGNPRRITITGKRGLNLANESVVKDLIYSSDGRFILSTSEALDFKTTYDIDLSSGLIESQTAANRKETTFEYGPFGRTKKTIHPDNMEESSLVFWAIDHEDAPDGAILYKWSAASGVPAVMTFYDETGRELRTVSKGFNDEKIYTDTEYDSKGRVSKKSLPYFNSDTLWTTFAYDSYGRVETETSPDNVITVYNYDELETTITIRTESDTVISRKKLNALGELIESEDNLGNIIYNAYNPDGTLKYSVVDSDTRDTTYFEYDSQGNRISITDPDAGTITSLYDAFGQLVQQISANRDSSTYQYDAVGRVSKSTDERGDIFYSYISDTTKAAFGAVDSVYNSDHSLQKVNTYDSDIGYLLSETSTGEGKSFTNTLEYDWFGRPMTRTYPSGLEIQYGYSSNGDLKKVTGEGLTLWACSDANALGQITSYSQGSYSTSISYSNLGVLNSVETGSVVDMEYEFDKMGNLARREDLKTAQKELFEYDNLNRLTGIDYYNDGTHITAADLNIGFDDCGNIISKTGVSSSILYGDDSAGPHALTKIENPDTSYYPSPQGISYTCFNKVSSISDTLSGGIPLSIDFTYGLGNQRIKTAQSRDGSMEQVKWFNGDYEEDSTSAGLKKYHYISGGNGLTAIFVKQGSGNDTMYHVFSDHLGSLTTIVNASTNSVENYSFNAWGTPRDPDNWDQPSSGDLFAGRGYTGHEHLTDFNLINMNGRVYDPVLGRFLSPDPYVQLAGYPNNFNRYSYALNNPLIYTDPDGEFAVLPLLLFLIGNGIMGGAFFGQQSDGSFDWGEAAKGAGATVLVAGSMVASAYLPGASTGMGGLAEGLLMAGAQYGFTALNTGATSWMATGEFNPNWVAAGFSAVPYLFQGVSSGFRNLSNDLTFISGKPTGKNWLAYEYTFDQLSGEFKYLSDLGGADLHFYHIGNYTDAGSGFIWRSTVMSEGKYAINSFRFWESAISTISAFSAPAAGLAGYFLEPKGPSSKVSGSNQRIPAGQYELRPHWRELYGGKYSLHNPDLLGNRSAILMHKGQYYGNTEGCLLPGCKWESNRVYPSGPMLDPLQDYIGSVGYGRIRLNIFDLF